MLAPLGSKSVGFELVAPALELKLMNLCMLLAAPSRSKRGSGLYAYEYIRYGTSVHDVRAGRRYAYRLITHANPCRFPRRGSEALTETLAKAVVVYSYEYAQ